VAHVHIQRLREQVWRDYIHKFARRDHFGFLPELREVARVAGDEVVGADGVGAFHEYVVVRVACDVYGTDRRNELGAFADQVQELAPQSLANFQRRTREYDLVFGNDGFRDIESGRFRDGEQEDGALQAVWPECGGDNDIRIDDQPQGQHDYFCRFFFAARAARMMVSI